MADLQERSAGEISRQGVLAGGPGDAQLAAASAGEREQLLDITQFRNRVLFNLGRELRSAAPAHNRDVLMRGSMTVQKPLADRRLTLLSLPPEQLEVVTSSQPLLVVDALTGVDLKALAVERAVWLYTTLTMERLQDARAAVPGADAVGSPGDRAMRSSIGRTVDSIVHGAGGDAGCGAVRDQDGSERASESSAGGDGVAVSGCAGSGAGAVAAGDGPEGLTGAGAAAGRARPVKVLIVSGRANGSRDFEELLCEHVANLDLAHFTVCDQVNITGSLSQWDVVVISDATAVSPWLLHRFTVTERPEYLTVFMDGAEFIHNITSHGDEPVEHILALGMQPVLSDLEIAVLGYAMARADIKGPDADSIIDDALYYAEHFCSQEQSDLLVADLYSSLKGEYSKSVRLSPAQTRKLNNMLRSRLNVDPEHPGRCELSKVSLNDDERTALMNWQLRPQTFLEQCTSGQSATVFTSALSHSAASLARAWPWQARRNATRRNLQLFNDLLRSCGMEGFEEDVSARAINGRHSCEYGRNAAARSGLAQPGAAVPGAPLPGAALQGAAVPGAPLSGAAVPGTVLRGYAGTAGEAGNAYDAGLAGSVGIDAHAANGDSAPDAADGLSDAQPGCGAALTAQGAAYGTAQGAQPGAAQGATAGAAHSAAQGGADGVAMGTAAGSAEGTVDGTAVPGAALPLWYEGSLFDELGITLEYCSKVLHSPDVLPSVVYLDEKARRPAVAHALKAVPGDESHAGDSFYDGKNGKSAAQGQSAASGVTAENAASAKGRGAGDSAETGDSLDAGMASGGNSGDSEASENGQAGQASHAGQAGASGQSDCDDGNAAGADSASGLYGADGCDGLGGFNGFDVREDLDAVEQIGFGPRQACGASGPEQGLGLAPEVLCALTAELEIPVFHSFAFALASMQVYLNARMGFKVDATAQKGWSAFVRRKKWRAFADDFDRRWLQCVTTLRANRQERCEAQTALRLLTLNTTAAPLLTSALHNFASRWYRDHGIDTRLALNSDESHWQLMDAAARASLLSQADALDEAWASSLAEHIDARSTGAGTGSGSGAGARAAHNAGAGAGSQAQADSAVGAGAGSVAVSPAGASLRAQALSYKALSAFDRNRLALLASLGDWCLDHMDSTAAGSALPRSSLSSGAGAQSMGRAVIAGKGGAERHAQERQRQLMAWMLSKGLTPSQSATMLRMEQLHEALLALQSASACSCTLPGISSQGRDPWGNSSFIDGAPGSFYRRYGRSRSANVTLGMSPAVPAAAAANAAASASASAYGDGVATGSSAMDKSSTVAAGAALRASSAAADTDTDASLLAVSPASAQSALSARAAASAADTGGLGRGGPGVGGSGAGGSGMRAGADSMWAQWERMLKARLRNVWHRPHYVLLDPSVLSRPQAEDHAWGSLKLISHAHGLKEEARREAACSVVLDESNELLSCSLSFKQQWYEDAALDAAVSGLVTLAQRAAISGSPVQPLAVTPRRGRSRIDGNSHSTLIRALQQLPQRASSATRAAATNSSQTAFALNAGYGQGAPLSAGGAAQSAAAGHSSPLGVNDQAYMNSHTGMNGKAGQAAHNDHAGQNDDAAQPGSAANAGQSLSGPFPGGGPAAPALWQQGVSFEGINSAVPLWSTLQGSLLPGAACWQPDLTTAWTISSVQTSFNVPGLRPLAATLSSLSYDALADEVRAGLNIRTEAHGRAGCATGRAPGNTRFCPDLNGFQVSMGSSYAAADGFSAGAAARAMTGHAPANATFSGAGACGAVDCGTAVPGAGSAAGAAAGAGASAAAGAVAGHCSFSSAQPDPQWSRLSLTSSMGAWTVAMALHCGSDVMSSLQRRSRDSLEVQELRDRVYYQSQFDSDEGSAAVFAHAHAHADALANEESAVCGNELAHGESAGCGDDLAHEEARAHAAHSDAQPQESAQVTDHGQSQATASASTGAAGAAGGRGAAAVARRRTVASSIKGAPEEIDAVSVRQPALLAVFTSRRLNDERREHQYSPWRTFYNEDESAWLSDLMAAVCHDSRDEQALLSTVLLCSDNREISTVLDAVNTAAARMHYQGSDDLGLPYHDHSHIPASRRALQAAAALHGTDGTAAAAGAPAPLDARGAWRSGKTGEVLAAGAARAADYAADGGIYGSVHDGYAQSGHNGQPGHNGSYSNHIKSAKSSHNGPYSQSRNGERAGLYGSRTQADLSHEWTTFWSWGSDLSAGGVEASLSAALFAPGSQSEQAVLAAKSARDTKSLTGSSADDLSGAGTDSVSAGALAGGTVPATSVLAEVAAEAARQAHYDVSGLSDLYGDSDVQDRSGNLDNPYNSQSDSLSASIADGTAILLACGKGSGLRPGINPFPSDDRHKSAGRRAAEAANMGTERSESLIKQAVHNSRDHMLDSLAGLIDPQRPHGPAEAGRLAAVPGTQGLSAAQGANGGHSLSSVQGTSAAQEAAAVAAAASGAQGAPLSSGKPGMAEAAGSPGADSSSELARAGILSSGPAAAYDRAALSEHGALTSGWVSLQLQRAAARNTYYLFAQTGGEGIIERSLLPPEILEQLAQQAEDSESVSGHGQGQMQGHNQPHAQVQTAVTGRNVAPIGSAPWQPGNGLQPLTALSTEQLWPVIVPAAPGDIRSALDNSAEYQAACDSAFAVSRAVFASSGIEQTTLKSPDKAMVEAACKAFAQADMAGCTLKRSRFYAGTDEAVAHAFAQPSRARSRREQQLQRQWQSQEQLQGNEQPQGDLHADRNQDLYSSGGLYGVSAGAHDEHHGTDAGAAAAAGTGYDSGQDRGHEGMPGYQQQNLISGMNLTDSIEGDDYLDNDSAADAMTTLYAGLGPDPDLRYGGDERSRALEQAAADLRVRVGQAQQRCREAAATVKTLADRVMGRFSSVELSQIEDTGDALPEFVLQIEDFVPDLYSRYAVFNTAADDFSWLGLPAGEPGSAQTSMVATRQHGTAQYLDFMLRYGSTPVRTSLSAHSMELVMSRALNAQLRSSSHQTTVLRHIFELYRLTLAHLETSSTPAALRRYYATGLKNVERAAVDFLVELITSLMRPQPQTQPPQQTQGQAQPDAHTSARAGVSSSARGMARAMTPQARPDLMGRAHVYEQGHAIGVSGVAQCDAVQGQALHRINNVVSAPAAAILREAESSLSSRVYFGDDSNAAARCAAGITIKPEVRSGSQSQQCHSNHDQGWFSAQQQDQAAAQRMLREELMLESHYEQFNEYTLVAFEFMDKLRKELDLDSFDWGINLTTAGEDYVYVRERNELSRRRACGEEPSGALDWQLLHSLLPEQKQRWFITRVLEVSSWLDNSHARRNSGYFEYAGVLSLKDRITMAALSPDFMTGAVTLLSSLMAINSPLAHSRTARRFDAIMAHSFRLPQEGRLPALPSAGADEQAPAAAPAAVLAAAAASVASGEETACMSQHQLERIRNFFVSRAITMAEQNDDSRRSIELQLLAPSAHDRVICLLCAQHLSALHPLYENMRDEMIQAWLPAPGSDLNALADKVRKDRELAREQIAARAPQGSVSSRPSELAEVLEVNDGYDAAYGQMLEAVSTALQDDYEVFSSELTRAAAARTRFKISSEEININFFSRLNQEHVDRICIMLGPDEVPKMKELVPVAGLARSEVRVVHCHEKLTTGLSQVTGTALTMHQELIRRLS